MTLVFLPDLWRAPQLLESLSLGPEICEAAQLCDHALHRQTGALPLPVPQPGRNMPGVLLDLADSGRDRLARLHAVFGAMPAQGLVRVAARQQAAQVFVAPQGSEAPGPVTLPPEHDAIVTLACAELLALTQTHGIAALQARWPMALSHAASRRRGQGGPGPSLLRGDWTRADIVPVRLSQPYAWFFGVREDDLQFRRFDGSFSEVVKRAGFVMSDAVTVLPYDPARDRVMLVEQFRYGPWLRGAENPWSLEPIAGRVDPFERPEAAALREAQEETGLTLTADMLRAVGNVYPSPGAITEFLYQYVALCDLPDGAEGVSGLASEAEDIRSHVVSFARLMELVGSGEVQNGPLVLTAWWLAAHRAELRAGVRD